MIKVLFLKLTLLLCLFLSVCGDSYGQSEPSLSVDPLLWSKIKAGLNQTPPPASYAFIPKQITEHFENQPDSVLRNHYAVMIRLERLFNLNAAIYVGEAMVRLAREQRNPARVAAAYGDLARYYDALGTYQLAATSIEKALAIYKVLGDENAILAAEYDRLSLRLHFVSREAVIPLMGSLLEEAMAHNAVHLTKKLHLRLQELQLLEKEYAEAERHVLYLEKLPESDPIKPGEYPFLINAAKGRADLALAKNDLAEAERYYLKTLRLCRAEPGPWFEIFTLHALTNLELKRGNIGQAKNYLEEARTKAEKLELHDLLSQTYALKSSIAELEDKPDDALQFFKKKIFHEEKFESRSEGFNLENFYLQAERDKLTANEKNRALELNLRKSQLTYSLVILLLVALLAVGLIMGYIRQRRGKAELADKNRLIQQHATQLETLDVAKSRFFANVSHELRTPLTLIAGPITTLLKEKQLSEKHARLLNVASRSVSQLESMVKDMLDLQKLEMGKMPLDLEPTELQSFFELHLGQFQSLAHSKQIHYSHEVKIAPGAVAELDREKCRQILYNLLSNAFKFTPVAGKIEVTVGLQNNILSLAVVDTGPGIHPDDLPHVFDRFFQTHRKSQHLDGGTGIGLALCHDYTKLLYGEIRAESKLGEGTSFYVSWPLALSEAQNGVAPLAVRNLDEGAGSNTESNTERSDPVTTAPTSKPTLLVVEDNPGLQEYLILILSEKYRVVSAENGKVALQKLAAEESVDLILSDLMMPVMDGYQLLEKLKSGDTTRHIPVIMLTARADPSTRLRALRIGVDDYLTKPFDEEELLVRIANLLKNQSARTQDALAENQAAVTSPQLSQSHQAWLEKFEAHVRENLTSDMLDVPSLSETFAMSESTLLRQLKRLTGLSPQQYLREIRLNESRELLENGAPVSIAVLAARVGYKNAGSFSRSFKNRFGKLPSDFV
ncbi:response regulator [Persicitalea sp.]|uniref:response regulator n=1 Tax=Persicitalea sp. TaxID=3100273 RepID=UPI00359480ED